jgi:hypothetical protein
MKAGRMKDESKPMPIDLKTRTTDFALAVVRMYAALPKKTEPKCSVEEF